MSSATFSTILLFAFMIAVIVSAAIYIFGLCVRFIYWFILYILSLPVFAKKGPKKTVGGYPLGIDMPLSNNEDIRAQEVRRKTKIMFEQQRQQMRARALKPHSADCPDILSCDKELCFVPSPDKIIRETTVSRKSDKQRRDEVKVAEAKVKGSLRNLKFGMHNRNSSL